MPRHHAIHTEQAPAALGPYSQAIALETGEATLLFLAGQIPLDPRSGELVTGAVESQVRRVMQNLQAVLAAAGSSLDRVVKTTIFLADMNDFEVVNSVYGEFFDAIPPARSTIQAGRLPKDVKVEIDVIAYR